MKRSALMSGIAGLTLVTLACNLASSTGPATLVPRPTATPPATIGYATFSPEEIPENVATLAPQEDNSEIITIINQIDEARLLGHIQALASFTTRHVNSGYSSTNFGIGAARSYIFGQFQQIADQSDGRFQARELEFTADWTGTRSTAYNIMGVVQGTEVGRGIIVIGAHYDTITQNVDDPQALNPGANDNASGTAAVIELARVFSQRQYRSTLVFVAFSAEEVQRQGSIAFVRDYVQANNLDVTAMINVDIIGSSTGPNGTVNSDWLRLFSAGGQNSPSRRLAQNINLIGQIYMPQMDMTLLDAIDRDGRYGDHISFSENGYAAIRVIEAQDDLNRTHNASDNLDDIQVDYMRSVVQAIGISVLALGDGPNPPGNITYSSGAGGVETIAWEPVPRATSYIIGLRRPGDLRFFFVETNNDTPNVSAEVFDQFEAVAIAARDENGLMGPLSPEQIIQPPVATP